MTTIYLLFNIVPKVLANKIRQTNKLINLKEIGMKTCNIFKWLDGLYTIFNLKKIRIIAKV